MKTIVTAITTACLLVAGSASARTYEIDPVHSSIAFFIDHIGYNKILGVVNEYAGEFDFDASSPEASSLNVKLKVTSINTNSKQRDGDIQGADWFNSAEFPEITFAGKAFKRTGETTGLITGDLTIAGITREVSLDTVFNREGDNPFDKTHVIGFSARATLLRSDFGMKTYLPLVGDKVDLVLEIGGTAKN